jgi:hypothetical protein
LRLETLNAFALLTRYSQPDRRYEEAIRIFVTASFVGSPTTDDELDKYCNFTRLCIDGHIENLNRSKKARRNAKSK